MFNDDFSFDGLEPIEARILKLAPQIVYITLLDRTDRTKDDRLGRFDLDEAHAEPYLAAAANPRIGAALSAAPPPAPPNEEPPDDEDETSDEEDGDEDEADDGADDAQDDDPGWPIEYEDDDGDEGDDALSRTPTTSDIARAACCWIRDCAIRNTVGEAKRRFRVRAWGPKGMSRVDSGQFVCRNHAYSDEMDVEAADTAVPQLQIPKPSFDESAKDSALKGIKALGDYYAQWGQIVLGSVGQLQGVNNSMLGRLHRQLQESRGQVDELVASILEFRVSEVEAQERRRIEEHAGDARSELARDALQQLGTAATAFLAGRSLPPDLLETFGAISTSPELTEALRDPSVRALMQDSDNLRGLAAMLQAAGQQAQAAEANPGSAGHNPGVANPTPDTSGPSPVTPATGPPDPGGPQSPTPETTQPEPHAAD